jgi:catechol 2,3-dioxygenase-like lactoylglutathione lyase family enzyme
VTPTFDQIGFVVEDLDAALAYWIEVIGVAPFSVYRDFRLAECLYEGEPIELTISVAYGQAGHVQVELVEQHGDTPSAYLGRASGDAHHVAFWTPEYDRHVEAYCGRGLVDLMWGSASGRADERFVYFAPKGPGPMIEVTEVLPAKAETYRAIAEAARTYDGSEPVREVTLTRRRDL